MKIFFPLRYLSYYFFILFIFHSFTLLFFCSIAFLPTVVAAANSKTDSLLILLHKDKEDTNKANHLIALCGEYRKISNYDSALYYGNAAARLSQQLGFKNWNYSGPVSGGRAITAPAIDTTNNNTSAFSSCFNVVINSNPVIPYCNNLVATFICDSVPTTVNQLQGSSDNYRDMFQVYPNPTKRDLQIRIKDLEFINAVPMAIGMKIYDVLGQEVYQSEIKNPLRQSTESDEVGQSEIHLDLENGIYFLKITTNNFSITKKLQIIR